MHYSDQIFYFNLFSFFSSVRNPSHKNEANAYGQKNAIGLEKSFILLLHQSNQKLKV
jgi:hypothetical protein